MKIEGNDKKRNFKLLMKNVAADGETVSKLKSKLNAETRRFSDNIFKEDSAVVAK